LRGRTGRAGTAWPDDLGRAERVRSGTEQLAGVEVEEHQDVLVDADPDPPAAHTSARSSAETAEIGILGAHAVDPRGGRPQIVAVWVVGVARCLQSRDCR